MKLTRPRILRLAFGLFFSSPRAAGLAAEPTTGPRARPNIPVHRRRRSERLGRLPGGHPQVQTPNIDQLAARGTLFANARIVRRRSARRRATVFTGLRPTALGSYGLKPGIRELAPAKEAVTLPQAFRRAGYFTGSAEKFSRRHGDACAAPAGSRGVGPRASGQAPASSSPRSRNRGIPRWTGAVSRARRGSVVRLRDRQRGGGRLGRRRRTGPSSSRADFGCRIAVPVPQKWFDLHPDATLKLPAVRDDDRDDTPRFSWYLH